MSFRDGIGQFDSYFIDANDEQNYDPLQNHEHTIHDIIQLSITRNCANFSGYNITNEDIPIIERKLADYGINTVEFGNNGLTIMPDGDFTTIDCGHGVITNSPKWPCIERLYINWVGQLPNWTTLTWGNFKGSIQWSELPNIEHLIYADDIGVQPARLQEWPKLQEIYYNGRIDGYTALWPNATKINFRNAGNIYAPNWNASSISLYNLTLCSIGLWNNITELTINCIVKVRLPCWQTLKVIRILDNASFEAYGPDEKFPRWPKLNSFDGAHKFLCMLPFTSSNITINAYKSRGCRRYLTFRCVYFAALLKSCIIKWRAYRRYKK